jgi:hypothetical protein
MSPDFRQGGGYDQPNYYAPYDYNTGYYPVQGISTSTSLSSLLLLVLLLFTLSYQIKEIIVEVDITSAIQPMKVDEATPVIVEALLLLDIIIVLLMLLRMVLFLPTVSVVEGTLHQKVGTIDDEMISFSSGKEMLDNLHRHQHQHHHHQHRKFHQQHQNHQYYQYHQYPHYDFTALMDMLFLAFS